MQNGGVERWQVVQGCLLYVVLLALAAFVLRELAPGLPLWLALAGWAPGPLVLAWLSTVLDKDRFGLREYLSSPFGVVASWLAFAGISLPVAAILG